MATYKQKFNKRHKQPINQSNSVAKIARLSGISVANARKIVKKGEGAYRSNPKSVRPQVMSATQWGLARLYASVSKGSKSSKIDKDLLK
tara:strand:- start:1782 stop:2048 length:267 start_codon:yes stop_codon:yes gene_type:complete